MASYKRAKGSNFRIEQTNLPLLQVTTTTTPTSQNDLSITNLQITVTPTPTLQNETLILTSTLQNDLPTLNFTLNDIGYIDTVLNSPFDNANYNFRLPKNWAVQGDNNFLVLDLSYNYQEIDTTVPRPGVFGELIVRVNDEIAETLTVEDEFEHRQLQIQLPQSLFADNQGRNTLDIVFDANLLCAIPHEAQLTIHSVSSQISLSHNVTPPLLDLSVYPEPFYQQSSFLPDNARFVLPSLQTNEDATNAIRIAAKLGNLTNSRLPISSTLDVEITDLLSEPTTTLDEHLIILGKPDNNQFLSFLNETTELSIPFYPRQLELSGQGPTFVSPGDTFGYTFTATNTSAQNATLLLIDQLPQYTQLIECIPNCDITPETGSITWSNNVLAPGEFATFSLTLSATNLISDDITVDNIMTLIEDDLGPINANSLSTTITTLPEQTGNLQQVSSVDGSDYFFMYNGQAVAEDDGIIQEIISPWNENRAILIITGSNNSAVKKASLAISSEAHIPGMVGPTALVKDVILSDLTIDIEAPPINISFQDLGYGNVIQEGGFVQDSSYFFELPYGWQPNNNAYLDLYFSHSQLLDTSDSSVTVNFNRNPLASFPLNEDTALNGNIRVPLPESELEPGRSNRIDIETNIQPLGEVCGQNKEDLWFTIKANSEIFLDQSEFGEVPLDLKNFPYPFDTQPTLFDLLFALPENPTQQHWEHALNLAAALGDFAEGETLTPLAILGNNLLNEDELSNYHIIAIGQPTLNPLIQQANSQLPQPFIPNSNEIQQLHNNNIVFRISPNVDLGLIQLIPSPWNMERAFIAVTGTTEEGVKLSANTTISRRSLDYTLVLIQADKSEAIDVSGLFESGLANAIATAIPESIITSTTTSTSELDITPTLVTTSSAASQQIRSNSQPIWLIPLVIGTILAIGVIFVLAFWQSRQQK